MRIGKASRCLQVRVETLLGTCQVRVRNSARYLQVRVGNSLVLFTVLFLGPEFV